MGRLDDELKSRFESEQQKAMLNILFTANWIKAMQVERFSPFGISAQQYNILRILRGAKGHMNMHNVKERMIDRAPNATRLTDKLIAKGLVQRERDDKDRRVVHVWITERGLELLNEIARTGSKVERSMLERMDPGDAAIVNRALDALRG